MKSTATRNRLLWSQNNWVLNKVEVEKYSPSLFPSPFFYSKAQSANNRLSERVQREFSSHVEVEHGEQ